ncbi:MAG: hypothetical protein R3C32_01925 [Chloroflexota bacterium]
MTAQDASAVPLTGETISVTSLWGGSEQVVPEGARRVHRQDRHRGQLRIIPDGLRVTVLQSRIAGGNPPDVSILPGIGFLRRFAKDGSIETIQGAGPRPRGHRGELPPGTLEVGKVAGELYALMVKFNSRARCGTDPTASSAGGDAASRLGRVRGGPRRHQGGRRWRPRAGCRRGDDWTLTDWFESIYIRQAGPDKYDQLFSGALPWTDQSVLDAIATMQTVLNDDLVAGGISAALGRGFVDGIGQVFSASPVADVYYEGGFVGGIATGQVNTALEPGKTIDWFDFPSINGGDGVTIGGDVIAALTTNPGVKEFVEYMTTPESGDVWAATGAIISPILGVNPDVYPNELVKKEAAQVAGASAVRFDGSDLLPASAPSLGALLQSAISGQDVAPLLASFEEQVQAAWANE